MRRFLVLCATGLLLALPACKPDRPTPMLAPPSPMMAAARIGGTAGDTQPRIAYSHSFMVELPGAAVQAAQQKALTVCRQGGCSVLTSRISQTPDGAMQGALSVRVAPDRYQAFADTVTAPPARLVSHTETAEDKTVPLLDLEKRLEAQAALRERLTRLLQQAGSSVGDVVAVEKQLAEVQGTIESETAQRDYLRTLTDTVRVDVTYNGLIQQAGPFDVSPIRTALAQFVPGIIESVGVLILWIAYALPWLPLGLLAAWVTGWMVGWLVRRSREHS